MNVCHKWTHRIATRHAHIRLRSYYVLRGHASICVPTTISISHTSTMKVTDWAKDMIADLEADPESYESWFADINDVLVCNVNAPTSSVRVLTN